MMKKFMFFCLMALGCMASFSSCGDDDDDEIVNNGGDVAVRKAELKETSNQLILTYAMSYNGVTVNEKWTCTFDGETLVSSYIEITYPNESMAKLAYDEAVANEAKVTLKGKTISVDTTDEYKDMTRTQIKVAMEALKAQYS